MKSQRKYKRSSVDTETFVYIPKQFRAKYSQFGFQKIYKLIYPYLLAFITSLLGIFLAWGLWEYHPDLTAWNTFNTQHIVESALKYAALVVADGLIQLLGVAAFFYPGVLLIWGVLLLLRRKITFIKTRIVFAIFATFLMAYVVSNFGDMHPLKALTGSPKFPAGLGGVLGALAVATGKMFFVTLPAIVTYIFYGAVFSIALVLSVLSLGFSNAQIKQGMALFSNTIIMVLFYAYIALKFSVHAVSVIIMRSTAWIKQRGYKADYQNLKNIEPRLDDARVQRYNKLDEEKELAPEQNEALSKGIVESFKEKTLRPRPVKQVRYKNGYTAPPLDLLTSPPPAVKDPTLSRKALDESAENLIQVLSEFGVKGQILGVKPGPVVTLYELEPAAGVKSARIISLADDIARSMSARSARVSVLPGRNAMGIELPNEHRETVYFREVLASSTYKESSHQLPIGLGKDIGGHPVIADLTKMPHLLVAGTTGSGKSVGVNAMILSLLFKLSPDECKFIMIDPKMLELSVYDGIPHLLSPVVTEPKKAIVALKWVVQEMEARYRSMAQLGVRNIHGYNEKLRKASESGEVLSRRVQTGFDTESGAPIFEDQALDMTLFPYIVVVVDEMADLMLVAGKEIEAAVQRLAQMARAAGIHLIMATQRPSVDVITGTIKANFPTRIGFQVTSKIDSRTILGEQGAEQLLGRGDMLFMEPGGRIRRVHGAFVGDDEVERIVSQLKQGQDPNYVDIYSISEDAASVYDDGMMGSADGSGDELYDKAMNIVLEEGKVSTSFVQRHLSIGYNRAAKIIERMEKEGVISAPNHVGKRDILVPHQKR